MAEVTITGTHPTGTDVSASQSPKLLSWRCETQAVGASTWTSSADTPIAAGEALGAIKFQNVGAGPKNYRAFWKNAAGEGAPSAVVVVDATPLGKPLPGTIVGAITAP